MRDSAGSFNNFIRSISICEFVVEHSLDIFRVSNNVDVGLVLSFLLPFTD